MAMSQPRARKVQAVSCSQQGDRLAAPLAAGSKALVAGLAAAALMLGAPSADARVILVQPEVKNFVKDAPPAAPGAPKAAKSAPAKRPPADANTSEGFDFKPLVLPLALVAVAGGGVALSTIDPGFAEMMVEAGSKDSRSFAGYEPGLKDTPFFGGSGAPPTSVPGNNTPAKGGKKAGTKKKGGFF